MESSTFKHQAGGQEPVAPEQEVDDVSFGLHALGELHDQEQTALAPTVAASVPSATPEGSSAAAEDAEGKPDLQSALDWYKDWLTSMK